MVLYFLHLHLHSQYSKVPSTNLVGSEGEGFKIAMAGLDGGRLNISACSLGAAQACYEAAREYVKVRSQFGSPLATQQSIQFKLADMASEIQSSRLTLRFAAQQLDDKHPNATAACAMAKVRVGPCIIFPISLCPHPLSSLSYHSLQFPSSPPPTPIYPLPRLHYFFLACGDGSVFPRLQ